jgi:putative FmdB family regulatory protein
MPIYAFECGSCGHSFDRLQRLADPDPDTCPECQAQAIRRQLTAPQFRLAGSGWYETDFKKDGEKKRNLVEGGDKSGAESKSESKAESKPDAKPEASASKPDSKPAPSAPAKTESKPASPPPSSSTN